MKISSLLHGFNPDLEERKRTVQRKTVGDAYKKHAKYTDASKNPMLQALENLLSGKTEKDLHKADAAARKDTPQSVLKEKLPPEVNKEINHLKQTEREVIAHENAHKAAGAGVTGGISYTHTKGPDDQRYITGGEVLIQMPSASESDSTISLLEKVRQAALAAAEPSAQDLRVAASASAQIQLVRAGENGKTLEEEELAPFAEEDFAYEVPERFISDFARDPQEGTVFGKELENLLYQRTYNKAVEKYSSHINMVKMGYNPFIEPTFSQSA
ncbi:putative metalloprotease CJM1_0395 family protein [Solibacillus sp. FSL K6-1523]|uniref:putative metalloprotease CJM1_0395 family protein n=1 Tax=Solibacillus sp. FSL K6-1523 TaxID=2921471 RepID=UPI0030F67B21